RGEVLANEAEAVDDFAQDAVRVLATVAFRKRQVVRDAVTLRAYHRPFVIDEREALGRAQSRLDIARERVQQRRRIFGAVIAARAGVGEYPRRTAFRHLDALFLIADRVAAAGRRALHFCADRDDPPLARRFASSVEHEALLPERRLRGALRLIARERGDRNQRRARLVDERRQDAVDRLARRRRDRFPQVLGGS